MPEFITESELKDFNEMRQKEWERVRKPSDPIKRPEVPVDNRPLWKQLKDEKDANDARVAELLKFSNQVWSGYDDEEAMYYKAVAQAGKSFKDEIHDEVKDMLKQGESKRKEKFRKEMGVAGEIVVEKAKELSLASRFQSSSSKNTEKADETSIANDTEKIEDQPGPSKSQPVTKKSPPVKKVISNQKRRLASIVKVKNHPIKKSKLGLADYSSSSSSSDESDSD